MRAGGTLVAAVVVLASLSAVWASEQAGPALTTPERIEAAVVAGELDRITADTYLWAAFTDPAAVPARFVSSSPWSGTLVLRDLRARLDGMPAGPDRARLEAISLGLGLGQCLPYSTTPMIGVLLTDHFRIEYTPGATEVAGLTIQDYADALEGAWVTLIDDFGWAAPPTAPYLVRVEPSMMPGLYGFVASGTQVGDNPNSPWDDHDAYTSCMGINANFSGLIYPSAPIDSLRSTAAHEFLHSLQFGIGALHGSNVPDSIFIEGGASWVEDEVYDDADDNHYFLWPNLGQSMGAYTGSPYNYWVVLRGLTERFGTGTAGGGQVVIRDFFERTSRGTGNMLTAIEGAMAARGVPLGVAFHDTAIALWFLHPCEGGYTLPHCYEEADDYVATSGFPSRPAVYADVDEQTAVGVPTDYAMRWVILPDDAPIDVTIGTDDDAAFRATIVCDTGTGLTLTPLGLLGSGDTVTATGYDPSGCEEVVMAVTNERVTAANPSGSPLQYLNVLVGAA